MPIVSCVRMKAAGLVEIKAMPLIHFSASKRWHTENVCTVTWEILEGCDNHKVPTIRLKSEMYVLLSRKSEGVIVLTDGKDNITLP